MRLILSRKGFDSAAGKVPSPILEDGRLVSLPIPDRESTVRYDEIDSPAGDLGTVVPRLTRDRSRADHRAHLDPDLVRASRPRQRGWQPCFGQAGAAQSALAREGVDVGDLFLFFGWFRQVEETADGFRYVPRSPDLHVIFGWLQIGKVIDLAAEPAPAWAAEHPHCGDLQRKNDTLYVASKHLSIGESAGRQPSAIRGGGAFRTLDPALTLTAPEEKRRSHWDLPGWFYPSDERPPLGYHSDLSRWTRRGDRVGLTSAARGQEFVLDVDHYPEAMEWIRGLPWT